MIVLSEVFKVKQRVFFA